MVMSRELLALGEQVGAQLVARGETVAVAESAAAGLIAAALLAVPGASAYFAGGAVVYTRDAKTTFLHLDAATVTDPRPSTEAHARILARGVRDALGATWAIGETGAAGPTGNRYGDAAGHACFAIVGPVEEATTLETASDDRVANMEAFAAGALRLLLGALSRGA
jgi:nicotinamide-nucleotide amidase